MEEILSAVIAISCTNDADRQRLEGPDPVSTLPYARRRQCSVTLLLDAGCLYCLHHFFTAIGHGSLEDSSGG